MYTQIAVTLTLARRSKSFMVFQVLSLAVSGFGGLDLGGLDAIRMVLKGSCRRGYTCSDWRRWRGGLFVWEQCVTGFS